MTLRSFCTENALDPGNISRIENDIVPPPGKEETVERLALALKIKKGSAEWKRFFDLADLSRGKVPKELDERIVRLLPALCRKDDGSKLSEEDIKKLIKLIKGQTCEP